MSRIRLLNLPRECTEAALKEHLTAKLSPTAPSMEITDCFLKKSYDGSMVRMGFVGFKTSAAGHFAVKHFNGSYFKNCKLRVELATGLNESTVTMNLKKKASALGASILPKYLQGAPEMIDSELSRKRTRDEGSSSHAMHQDETPTSTLDHPHHRSLEERKKEFVSDRMKITGVPSWSNEVLVPVSSEAHVPDDTSMPHVSSPLEDEVETERRALEKQRALGSVDDMDFLSSIGEASAVAAPAAVEDTTPLENSNTAADSSHEHSHHSQQQTPSSTPEELARESRRLMIRGVPFSATEDEVKNFLTSKIGPVESVHIPLTRDTKQSKGCAFVKFETGSDAVKCLTAVQGGVFMGRLLRITAVEDDPYAKKAAETAAKMSTKATGGPMTDVKLRKAEQRAQADAAGVSSNSTYMSMHTAVSSMAKRLGVANADIVSVESKGAAVRAAVAEAFLTSEVKTVLGDEGIDLDMVQSTAATSALKPRSSTTILVKNLTPSADLAALSKMFLKFGAIDATAIPTSGAFALFRFVHPQDARVAFQRSAYKPFCGQPLFLEWAPVGCIKDTEEIEGEAYQPPVRSSSTVDDDTGSSSTLAAKTQQLTLFVTNVPFGVTDDEWVHFLQDSCPRLVRGFSEQIPRYQLQADKGRCFITCKDAVIFKYLLTRINGKKMGSRTLSCVAAKTSSTQESHDATATQIDKDDETTKASSIIAKGAAAASSANVPPGCNPLKVIVKNLPFEATEKDLRELFAAFTEIKAVRVPKKVNQFGAHRDNNHRGFGFVEFLTEQEAASAIKALSSTHLYGRHLVLQYAKMEQ